MTETGIPRKSHAPGWAERFANMVRDLARRVERLERGASLRNSSISGGDGLKVYDNDLNLVLSIDTSGAVTAYGGDDQPVARYGKLENSAPGEYGVEVNVDGGWVRLGYQTTGWSQIQKPATYDTTTERWTPSPHTHPGGDITSQVPSAATAVTATTATSANTAADADGTASGFARTVGGTEYYALWVDNTSGFKFGRNVSSRKYKQNIRPWSGDPKAVLNLVPVRYERKPQLDPLPDGVSGPANQSPPVPEYGLIAEDTHQYLPEIVTTYQGEIDGIRYDLLGVAMLPVLKDHDGQLTEQDRRIQALEAAVREMGGNV